MASSEPPGTSLLSGMSLWTMDMRTHPSMKIITTKGDDGLTLSQRKPPRMLAGTSRGY